MLYAWSVVVKVFAERSSNLAATLATCTVISFF